jgi:hypothetical protein
MRLFHSFKVENRARVWVTGTQTEKHSYETVGDI